MTATNLTLARREEAQGDLSGALAAARRRTYVSDPGEPCVLVALSTFLKEEGRLAALTGDRSGAIAAYRHYLPLRDVPEPAGAAEVAQVRSELAGLVVQP